ncbi:MAG: argininosuccinate lyase [Alphaproteobacteria bacterium]|nr:argininosuccinate lyase [Alphaproteobacteria bacterium]
MSEDRTPARSLGGRFTEATHPVLERINRSVDVDRRLWDQDIRGSQAHAAMLAHVGLIPEADKDAIVAGLDAVRAELADGTFVFLPSDEDIHMAVERRLGERIGAPAGRLHTGRSRNDQVMVDVTLWLRDNLPVLRSALVAWCAALLHQAEHGADVPMPSYTHLQPAQVSSVGQWLCAHAAEVSAHVRRLDDLLARLDACPLGSGASAGGYLPIDRRLTASLLGFARPTVNATATTGSRTDLLDVVGLLALLGTTLSRFGEEIVLFLSPSFGFLTLPDRLTTGSSLLPQKRNPDGAELLRGAGKLAAGDFAALASAVAGIPSGYSKDLQADKEVLFRAWDRTVDLVALATLHAEALGWKADRLAAACTPELASLWLADRLVLAGLPFREAHHLVGRAVREAVEAGTDLHGGLSRVLDAQPDAVSDPDELRTELRAMTPAALLGALVTEGGAGPASVRAQVATLRASLAPRA